MRAKEARIEECMQIIKDQESLLNEFGQWIKPDKKVDQVTPDEKHEESHWHGDFEAAKRLMDEYESLIKQ